jgi:hypothetical protein
MDRPRATGGEILVPVTLPLKLVGHARDRDLGLGRLSGGASAAHSLLMGKGISDLINRRRLIETVIGEACEGNRVSDLAYADDRAGAPGE